MDTKLRQGGKICTSCFEVTIFDYCFACDVDTLKCNLCLQLFCSLQNYKDHFENHKESFDIPKFEITFKQNSSTERACICVECKSIFVNASKLRIHKKRIHEQIRKFTCAHCCRKYKTKFSLRTHILCHLKKPSYVCDLCKKSYHTYGHLKSHIAKHTNGRSYACNLCDKVFNEKYSLSRHVLQHTSVKAFRCSQCEKCFMFNYSLRRHMLTHRKNKHFVCDICQKKYKWKVDIRRHIMGHIGEKSYVCPVCEKTFLRKFSLREHMFKHGNAKMYLCYCGKAFKFQPGLSRHKASHKIQN